MSVLMKSPRTEQWATRIRAQLGKSVESIIEIGRLLLKAKNDLVHGEWGRLFEDELVPFGRQTAFRLMAIADHPQLSNVAHAQHFPPAWYTLYELTKVPSPILKNAFRDGVITPDMPRKAVQELVVRLGKRDERPAKPLPVGCYRLIYADPPWQYEHVKTESRAIENQYPTMTLDAIRALEVPAANDAVLFLWATSPKLAEALTVIEAWRFTYRTCAVWDKEQIGMGYYFRQQHELLLVAARGALPVPEPSARPASVFRFPRGRHSEKPAACAAMLEAMYPNFTEVDRLELFSRTVRPGWSAWGNEPEELPR